MGKVRESMKKKTIKSKVDLAVRNYAELASVGCPGMEGIRLRFQDGCGQWINAKMLRDEPEKVVEYLNDWMSDQFA